MWKEVTGQLTSRLVERLVKQEDPSLQKMGWGCEDKCLVGVVQVFVDAQGHRRRSRYVADQHPPSEPGK